MTAALRERTRHTDGTIAMHNLDARIATSVAPALDVLSESSEGGTTRQEVDRVASLTDLLVLRGHLVGSIADYERATAVTTRLVSRQLESGPAHLAHARTMAALHRFDEAIEATAHAEVLGAPPRELHLERASIMQAVGHYDVAERLLDGVSQSSEDPTLIGSLAVLRAEQGHVSLAESLFDRAIQTLRGTSPFPLAQLVFRRGLMWMRVNEAGPARDWFSEATRLLPAYAPAVGHLAELDLAEGRPADAVEKLHSVARTSDDPEYAACLSEALSAAGDEDAAAAWRERAVARYEELEARHPEAFVDHAAAFWLGPGRDPIRGRALSLRALVTNHTDRSRDRALRALSFAGSAWPTPGASVV